jgi:hypothetical protein
MKKILFSSLLILLLSTVAFSQSNQTSPKADFAIISISVTGISNVSISIIYSDREKEEISKFKLGDELHTQLVALYSKLYAQGFEFMSETDYRITFIKKVK